MARGKKTKVEPIKMPVMENVEVSYFESSFEKWENEEISGLPITIIIAGLAYIKAFLNYSEKKDVYYVSLPSHYDKSKKEYINDVFTSKEVTDAIVVKFADEENK